MDFTLSAATCATYAQVLPVMLLTMAVEFRYAAARWRNDRFSWLPFVVLPVILIAMLSTAEALCISGASDDDGLSGRAAGIAFITVFLSAPAVGLFLMQAVWGAWLTGDIGAERKPAAPVQGAPGRLTVRQVRSKSRAGRVRQGLPRARGMRVPVGQVHRDHGPAGQGAGTSM